MPSRSTWCGAVGAKPEHEKCPGHHKVNKDIPCECDCGHPHLKPCLCGKTHKPEEKVASIEGEGRSSWCNTGDHKKCPGHQFINPEWICECDCGHPHLKENSVTKITKSAAPVKVDELPKQIARWMESPEQFEWWVSSRPMKDQTPEFSFTSNTALALSFAFLQDKVKDFTRIKSVGYDGRTFALIEPLSGTKMVRVYLGDWVDAMVYDNAFSGPVPYQKFHRQLTTWMEKWNAQDKEE